MLNSLRNSAGSWVVKVLLGLLIITFAIWGIGDIFRMRQAQYLAEVGNREISMQEFQRSYRNQMAFLSNRLGRQITSQEARTFGVTDGVLQNLISVTAVDIHADKLGLGISDDTIGASIRKDKNFEDSGGKFDPKRFQEFLRNAGLSEQGFVRDQRGEMVREQLAGAMTQGAYVPKTLIDALYHFRNDERVLKYFVVKPEVVGEIAAPDETALKSYYEENKASYEAPKYRRIGVLTLTPDAIKDTVSVTDEELKAEYEAKKHQYSTPERRTIQQLIFKDMGAAREAADKLAKGTDFVALGKELGMKESDINLGTFAKPQLADKKLAEAAFSLEKGKTSEPIDSFAPEIVKVTEITPAEDKTFDQVKDQVREALVKTKANNDIADFYNMVEDARAGGANVAEAAKKTNLPYAEYTIDARGLDKDGKPVVALAGDRPAIKLAFDSDVGVENNPVTKDDGYLFIDVLEAIPERQKPLDEVREDVKTAWIETEKRKRVRQKAEELVEKTKTGTPLDKAAEEIGATVATTEPLKRDARPKDLPPTAVSVAFTLPENGVGNVQMPDRTSQAVIQLAENKKAAPIDDKQSEALASELRQSMSMDILTQYIGGLQSDYGVRVNQQAKASIVGE